MKRTIKSRIGDMLLGWQGKPTEADRVRYEKLQQQFRRSETTLKRVAAGIDQAVYPRPGVIPSRDFLMKTIGRLQEIICSYNEREEEDAKKPDTSDQRSKVSRKDRKDRTQALDDDD
jgi:hypothetical protein